MEPRIDNVGLEPLTGSVEFPPPPRSDRTFNYSVPPVSLTLRVARNKNRVVKTPPPLRANGMRDLLTDMHARHYVYAALHAAAGRSALKYHTNLTVAILAISLGTTLATGIVQGLIEPVWANLMTNSSLSVQG